MGSQQSQYRLDEEIYRLGISELTSRDGELAGIVAKWGEPPFWTHPAGFPGLVLDILSQQVSLESAQATYAKLEKFIKIVRAERFLLLADQELLSIGFSRQKAAYVRGIAQEIVAGQLELEEFEFMDDELVRKRLLRLKGVGPWTAGCYLLFALRRADAWPPGDLALIKAVQEMRGLADIPSSEEVDRIALGWKPWRGVAARLLWHHYLCSRGRISPA